VKGDLHHVHHHHEHQSEHADERPDDASVDLHGCTAANTTRPVLPVLNHQGSSAQNHTFDRYIG
jgi:hypothetical protein